MIILIWAIQFITMAIFDTRKDVFNKIFNWSAFITSCVITYFWGGLVWLIVPAVIIPVSAGITGGIISGLKKRQQ